MCSPTFQYIYHEQNNSTVHSYMLSLFKARPRIEWKIVLYHYETEYYTENNKRKTREVKKISRTSSRDFSYISSRDVSGTFILDIHNLKERQNKFFIKLNLTLQVDQANDGTDHDFITQKEEFYNSNRLYDLHMDKQEMTNLEGFSTHNLISVNDKRPPYVNCWIYFFISVFGFKELYCLYFDSLCISQKFTIKKIISNRRDLNNQENERFYQNSLPNISYTNNYSHGNQDLPNENDILNNYNN